MRAEDATRRERTIRRQERAARAAAPAGRRGRRRGGRCAPRGAGWARRRTSGSLRGSGAGAPVGRGGKPLVLYLQYHTVIVLSPPAYRSHKRSTALAQSQEHEYGGCRLSWRTQTWCWVRHSGASSPPRPYLAIPRGALFQPTLRCPAKSRTLVGQPVWGPHGRGRPFEVAGVRLPGLTFHPIPSEGDLMLEGNDFVTALRCGLAWFLLTLSYLIVI